MKLSLLGAHSYTIFPPPLSDTKITQHVLEPSDSKPSSGSSSKWGSSVTVKTRKSLEDDDTDRQLGMDSSLKFPKEGRYQQANLVGLQKKIVCS